MIKAENRQKIILGFIVIALIVLIWQITRLVIHEMEMRHAEKTLVKNTAVKLSSSATVVATAHLAAASAAEQQRYAQLINQYQMTQVERLIAEDDAAIAEAKFKAAKALAQINQLPGNPPVNPAINDVNAATGTMVSSYELIYTGEENGQWTATLKKAGQFIDVTAGTTLADGTKVLAVDDNGVVIQQGNAKNLVTFDGVTPEAAQNDNSAAAVSALVNVDQSQQHLMIQAVQQKNVQTPVAPVVTTTMPPSASVQVGPAAKPQPLPAAFTATNAAKPQLLPAAPVATKPAVTTASAATKLTKSISTLLEPQRDSIPALVLPDNNQTAMQAPALSSSVTKAGTTVAPSQQLTASTKIAVVTATPVAPAQPAVTTQPVLPAAASAQSAANSSIAKPLPPLIDATQISSGFYTVQIIADDNYASVWHYLATNGLENKATVVKVLRNGNPWFIAGYGQFSSAASAERELQQLPQNLRNWGPFVRHVVPITTDGGAN